MVQYTFLFDINKYVKCPLPAVVLSIGQHLTNSKMVGVDQKHSKQEKQMEYATKGNLVNQ